MAKRLLGSDCGRRCPPEKTPQDTGSGYGRTPRLQWRYGAPKRIGDFLGAECFAVTVQPQAI